MKKTKRMRGRIEGRKMYGVRMRQTSERPCEVLLDRKRIIIMSGS